MQRAPNRQPQPPPPPPPASANPSYGGQQQEAGYFSESNLPSCKKSKMTPTEERSMRRRTCRFIQEVSRKLQLDLTTRASSFVIFHRFYAVHSFNDQDRFEVSMACVLLAAKTEECTRKLNYVIREAWRLKNGAAGANAAQNENVDKDGYLNEKCEEFVKLKERVLLLERVVLHTIGFELSIDHPYKFIFKQVQKITTSQFVEFVKPPPKADIVELRKKLSKSAVDFANDSLHTSLCLQYPPEKIALTCIYMSAQHCKIRPKSTDKGNRTWMDVLVPDSEGDDFSMDELTSITLQIVELIADKKNCKELDLFDNIKKDLNEMRKEIDKQKERSPKRPRMS